MLWSKQAPVLVTVSPEAGRPKLGLRIGSMPPTPERMKRRRLEGAENELDVSEEQSACRYPLAPEKGYGSIVIAEESLAPDAPQLCWFPSQTFHEAASVLGFV
jgi:hypothetical protein